MPNPRLLGLELPRELLANLTLRELRSKFKRSTLGWLWSIINPAASIAIYSIVFGVFFQVIPPAGEPSGMASYPLFLMCGLIPWTFLANGIQGATTSIVMNEGLIKKVYFPRYVLPTASVLAWLASYGVELLVLGVLLVVFGNMVIPWLPLLLVLIALHSAFILGIGLMLAAVNAYFRDVQHFLGIFLNVWFYATPVLYPIEQPPAEKELLGVTVPIRTLLELNPMTRFVEAYRDLLYHVRSPSIALWGLLALHAVVALTVGIMVFQRLEPGFAEEV